MRNTSFMSSRLYFPVHSRRLNRYCAGQLVPRHCFTRHLLRSCPLPLRTLHRCCLCYCRCFRSLVSTVFRLHPPQYLNKNSLWCHICWSQLNLLPSTLPRTSWYTSTILRLPRCLHPLKYSFFYWILNLTCSRRYIPLHYLGGICC